MYRIKTLQYSFIILLLVLTTFFNSENSIVYHSYKEFYLISLVLLILLTLDIFFRNKLFEIFTSFFLFFFLLRFSILLCFQNIEEINLYSLIIERNLDTNEIIDKITKIKFFLIFLFLSLIIFKTDIENLKFKDENLFERNFIFFISLLLITSTALYNLLLHENISNFHFIPQIFFNLFNWTTITPIILICLISYNLKDIKKYRLILIIFLYFSLYFASVIPSGSKSGFLYLLLFLYILFYLANYEEDKFVKLSIFLFPLIILISIFFWIVGILITEIAQYDNINFYYSYRTGEEIYKNGYLNYTIKDEIFISYKIKKTLNDFLGVIDSVIYRIGYLDFYLDKSIFEGYEKYINFNYYFKSFIDKVTPGFDVFGVPLASRSLYFSYFGYFPSNTQSEQMTMFAESLVLFKNYYFVYYIILSIFIKFLLILNRKIFKHKFLFNLATFYLLFFYFNLLTGFGLDTHLMELFYFYVIIFILKIFLLGLNKFEKL